MSSATARQQTSQPGDLPSWGRAMPTARDESTFNKTTWHVESSKSPQKTEMDGRHPHRAVRFHSRIGFTSHERELLNTEGVLSTRPPRIVGTLWEFPASHTAAP